MNFDARTNTSPVDRAAFLQWLTAQTVTALQAARDNELALHDAIKTYVERALAAHLDIEAIEDLLGISEPSIMDLAQLSEANEAIVVAAFEDLCNE